MSTIKISVTPSDITDDRDMRLSDGNTCMVAQAIRRRLDLPEEVDLDVGYSNFSIQGRKGDLTIPLPDRIGARIKRWDDGAKTRPFEFEVEFPDDWRKKITGHK